MGSKVNNLNIHLGESKARFELIFEEINQLAITNFTISNQMIIHGKLSSLRLDNSSIHGQLKADWKENNIKSAIEKGYNLKKIKDKNNFTKKDNKNIYKQSCLQAAKQFKLLKENYRKTGEYESEDTAYRNYMKYYVKSMKLLSRDFVKKIGYSIFGLISGYGTSVFRILLTCFFTILSFGRNCPNFCVNNQPQK
jgi:RecG-like helicase